MSASAALAGPTSVGTSLPRVDGVAKVTGRALYLDDLDAPNAWHGITVRSTIAHGVLDGIDRDPTFDWTDIVVATADDVPGDNCIYLIERDQIALVPVGGVIRHVDEAVAVVVAPTRARALAAARAITLRCTARPAVFSVEESLDCKVLLYGTDNIYKKFLVRKGHASDEQFEAAMAGAAHIITGEYRTSPQEQMYIETQAMMASWDGDRCNIVGSMQCPYYVHKAMKVFLGCDDDGVEITQSVTGGGFGGKEEYPSMLAAHCATAARVAGRPVKMVYDRDEDIAATTKRHPSKMIHRLGLAADGSIVAIDVDVIFDGGGYSTLSQVVLSRGVLHAAGPYKCPVTRIRGRAVATNYPPHGAFRGFGAPQTTFAYDRQMEKAARLLGQDPLEYRSAQALRSGDTTATGQELTFSVGTDEVLAAIRDRAGPLPKRFGVDANGAQVRRGRGVSFYNHGAGFTGSGEKRLAGRAAVAAMANGRFEVRSSSTDIGQGAITMFTQIAADALGVEAALVDVIDPSTGTVPDSGPTVASRTCMVVGSVVEQAAQKIKARLAAGELPASHRDGELVEIVQYEQPPGIAWDDETYTGSAYPVFGWAACLVDVAVDVDTYQVTIERCVHAVDVGRAINPVIVQGQIDGGTLQALGWAVIEDVTYKDGKVWNASMTNCIVPTFADAPDLETVLVEVPYPYGPSGAKGVGEIPMDGPAATVANAISNALGCDFDSLPVSPEKIALTTASWSKA